MRESDYPRDRLAREEPADMRVHGDRNCASTERFTCRACRRSVCWCKGGCSRFELDAPTASRNPRFSFLDAACCDDCVALLTENEWWKVFLRYLTESAALNSMRSRARALAFAAAYADRTRTAAMRFTP